MDALTNVNLRKDGCVHLNHLYVQHDVETDSLFKVKRNVMMGIPLMKMDVQRSANLRSQEKQLSLQLMLLQLRILSFKE